MDKYTELIENPKFNNLPLKEECFELIPPVKLSVGMIFTNDGSKIYSPYDEYTFHNFLWRVVKIEKLVDHPNHIVVSAILVGATVSTNIYQNIKVNKRGGKIIDGKIKRFSVTRYYDESYIKKEISSQLVNRIGKEKTMLFFISTFEKPACYEVKVEKLGPVKIPIETDDNSLGCYSCFNITSNYDV